MTTFYRVNGQLRKRNGLQRFRKQEKPKPFMFVAMGGISVVVRSQTVKPDRNDGFDGLLRTVKPFVMSVPEFRSAIDARGRIELETLNVLLVTINKFDFLDGLVENFTLSQLFYRGVLTRLATSALADPSKTQKTCAPDQKSAAFALKPAF